MLVCPKTAVYQSINTRYLLALDCFGCILLVFPWLPGLLPLAIIPPLLQLACFALLAFARLLSACSLALSGADNHHRMSYRLQEI